MYKFRLFYIRYWNWFSDWEPAEYECQQTFLINVTINKYTLKQNLGKHVFLIQVLLAYFNSCTEKKFSDTFTYTVSFAHNCATPQSNVVEQLIPLCSRSQTYHCLWYSDILHYVHKRLTTTNLYISVIVL